MRSCGTASPIKKSASTWTRSSRSGRNSSLPRKAPARPRRASRLLRPPVLGKDKDTQSGPSTGKLISLRLRPHFRNAGSNPVSSVNPSPNEERRGWTGGRYGRRECVRKFEISIGRKRVGPRAMSIRSCLVRAEKRRGNRVHSARGPNCVTPGQDQALALGCDPPVRLDLGPKRPYHPGLADGLNTAHIVTAYSTIRPTRRADDFSVGREHPNPSVEFHEGVGPDCWGQHQDSKKDWN